MHPCLGACRYRWFGMPLTKLDWWGALSYTIGVALYWVAALSTILNDCPRSTLSTLEYVSPPSCLSFQEGTAG